MARWEPGARERLVVAAVDLFTEQGYDATTVAQIAERAGVTRSTFFRHISQPSWGSLRSSVATRSGPKVIVMTAKGSRSMHWLPWTTCARQPRRWADQPRHLVR